MDPVTALVIAILILVFALGLPVLRAKFQSYSRVRTFRHESERFKIEPRVGDKAGYHARGESSPCMFVVGEVVTVPHFMNAELDGVVELETEITTAMGTVNRRTLWPVKSLRYFPPNTPLGIVNVNVNVNDEDAESVR